jgi:flagellar biogenesis protein FliO
MGVVVLVSLIGLAFGVRRLLPRFSSGLHSRNRLQSLELLALTPQCSVALVRVGQETLVLGMTPQSVTLLTKVDEANDTTTDRQSERVRKQPAEGERQASHSGREARVAA